MCYKKHQTNYSVCLVSLIIWLFLMKLFLMDLKKVILFITLFSFFILGISGLLLFFSFNEDVFRKVLGLNKSDWLSFHMIFAVINVILISYHVGSRWRWVEKYILDFNRNRANSAIKKRQISNFLMMMIFSLSLMSGFLAWILSGECNICLIVHKYTGFALWLAFLYHLILHRRGFII